MKIFVGIGEFTLDLRLCRSLKEKRQIIKSICAKVGKNSMTSICEAGNNDFWKSSVLMTSVLAHSSNEAGTALERVRSLIEASGVEVIDEQIWILCPHDHREWSSWEDDFQG